MRFLLDYLWIYLATAAVVIGLLWWRRVLRTVRVGWRRAARPTWLMVAIPFVLSLAISAWLCRQRMPLPGVHDEFSYLLGADTFAHGRLANPPHPMWEHFETMHVLQRPTYASKYPPGQAAILALGQVVWEPILGAWLGVALAAGAVAWALAAFVPRRWALLGGVVAAVHPQCVEWSQTYWGGGVAMLGGALVLGAAGRLARRPRPIWGAVLGLGMTVLASARPYEGLVVSAAAVVLALVGTRDRLRMIRVGALPAAAVLAAGFAWTGYYNFRVTGSPFVMPYALHEAAYASTPLFAWQAPRDIPPYRNQALWAFWAQWVFEQFAERRLTINGLLLDARERWQLLRERLFPIVWAAVPLLMLPLAHLRSARMRRVEIAFLAFAAASALCTFFTPTYWAPAVAMGLLIYVQCLRYFAVVRTRRVVIGEGLAALALVPLVMMSATWMRERVEADRYPTWHESRVRLLTELDDRPGKDLVIVRYAPGHSVHDEWVYNGADIDAAPIVFAHDLGVSRNAPLLDYFADRSAWLLTVPSPGGRGFTLSPYPQPTTRRAADRP